MDLPAGAILTESPTPLFVALARLVPHKRVDLLLGCLGPGASSDGRALRCHRRRARSSVRSSSRLPGFPAPSCVGRVSASEKERWLGQAWFSGPWRPPRRLGPGHLGGWSSWNPIGGGRCTGSARRSDRRNHRRSSGPARTFASRAPGQSVDRFAVGPRTPEDAWGQRLSAAFRIRMGPDGRFLGGGGRRGRSPARSSDKKPRKEHLRLRQPPAPVARRAAMTPSTAGPRPASHPVGLRRMVALLKGFRSQFDDPDEFYIVAGRRHDCPDRAVPPAHGHEGRRCGRWLWLFCRGVPTG